MENVYFLDSDFNIKILTKKEFVDEYSEKTTTPKGIGSAYFYDETDHYIWHYLSGKTIRTDVSFYDKEEALQFLFELAVEHSNINVFNSLTELKRYINQEIELAIDEEWDDDMILHLKNLLK